MTLLHSKFIFPAIRMGMPSTKSSHRFALALLLRKQLGFITRLYGRPAVLILLLYWLLRNSLHTIRRIVDYYTPLPTWDYWDIVLKLNEYRSWHLGALWM